MNIFKTFLFASLIFTASVSATSPVDVLKKITGELITPRIESLLERRGGWEWDAYDLNFRTENVNIRLPEAPVKQKIDWITVYSAGEGDNEYYVCGFPLAVFDGETDLAALETIFEDVLGLEQDSQALYISNPIQLTPEIYALDFTFENEWSAMRVDMRMIVSENNFFILATSYPADGESAHADFVSSIEIAQIFRIL